MIGYYYYAMKINVRVWLIINIIFDRTGMVHYLEELFEESIPIASANLLLSEKLSNDTRYA